MSRGSRRSAIVLVVVTSLSAVPATAAAQGEPTAGDAVEAVLAHVPEGHRDTCQPDLVDEPHSGDCSTAASGEGPYSIGGEPAGRYLCEDAFGTNTLAWTHDATGIFGRALQDAEAADLWEWWSTESGPLTTASDVGPSGLGAALDALIEQVPEGHRAGCLPFAGGGRDDDGVVVSVRCEVAPDLDVYYHQLESLEALEREHERDLASAGIEADMGDCSEAVPGELGYTIGGEPAGRLLCEESFDSITFSWTHESTVIAATLFAERPLADVWAWWIEESGPVG